MQENVIISAVCCKVENIIAFDVGRTLPNTDLSRDFMGLVVGRSVDLGTHIRHLPQIFLQGRRRESLGSRLVWACLTCLSCL